MTDSIIIILIQFFGLLSIICLLLIFNRQRRAVKFENRFAKFTLTEKNEDNQSIFDTLQNLCFQGFTKVGNILEKIPFLQKMSRRYEKIMIKDNMTTKPIDYIVIKVAVAWIFWLFYFILRIYQVNFLGLFGYVLFIILGFILPDIFWQIEYKENCLIIKENLFQAIVILNHSLNKGDTIIQAITNVQKELTGPIVQEFKQIQIDINYGLSVYQAFTRFYERVKLDDVEYMCQSLKLVCETNGTYAKAFNNIEQNFLARKHTTEEVANLINRSKVLYKILCSIPPIIFAIVCLFKAQDIWHLLFTFFGQLVIAFTFLCYISYLLVMKIFFEVNI